MRCPVCRAENGDDATCRRCRADLSLVLTVEVQRRRALAAASQAVALGHGHAVLGHAAAANALRRGDDAQRLLAVGHLLERDFAAAWRCFQTIPKSEPASYSTTD